MRAIVIDGHGALDRVRMTDVPEPQPGPGEVVVRMRAAALNHLDLWTIRGLPGVDLHFPHVLGADGAGLVAAVGDGVRGVPPGARVLVNPGLACRGCERCRAGEQSECTSFGMIGEHRSGLFAELACVPATNVFPYPAHLSAAEAAALGVTFITAYRMLFTRGRLRPGEWVLVTGVGGGLGLSLLQLARTVAGRVYVTSSSDDKLERAKALGADAGINYVREDVGRALRRLTGKRGVDLGADSAGGPAIDAALRTLRPGGRLVVAGATAGASAEIDLRRVFWRQLAILGSTMGSDADVSDMLRLVAGTGLRPVIDRAFVFEDAVEALGYLGSTDRFGKVVIEFPD